MYNWEELALKYKDEANKLRKEMEHCQSILQAKAPHCVQKAIELIESSLCSSDSEMDFIASFESSASKTTESSPKQKISKPIKRDSFKCKVSKDEYKDIEYSLNHIANSSRLVYEIVNCCGMVIAREWFENHAIDHEQIARDVYSVVDPKTKMKKTVKVLTSAMKFQGKTKRYGSEDELRAVPLQHTYLVDPKDPICDLYLLINFSNSTKEGQVYARIPGKMINKMLFDPLRERFLHKKACILQKDGYNNSDGQPYTVEQLMN